MRYRFDMRHRFVYLLAVLLLASCVAAPCALAQTAPSFSGNVLILGGETRYSTMAKEATAAFPDGSTQVIVASGENWPDALAASGLAGALDCPILLTSGSALADETASAITALHAQKVTIIGGTSSVSTDVEDQLVGLIGTGDVDRIAGANRYETARLIYGYGAAYPSTTGETTDGSDTTDIWSADTAIICSGNRFADAVSVAPLAFRQGAPIFLVNPDVGLTADDETLLSERAYLASVIICGGTASVPASVDEWLAESFSRSSVVRLSGSNRLSTSYAIASWCVENAGFSWNGTAFTTAWNYPDALCASALQGSTGAVILLTDDSEESYGLIDDAASQQTAGSVSQIRFLGGTNSTSQELRRHTFDDFFGLATTAVDITDELITGDASTTRMDVQTAETCNAYASPTETSEVLAVLDADTYLGMPSYDAGGGWYEITLASGTVAYVQGIHTVAESAVSSFQVISDVHIGAEDYGWSGVSAFNNLLSDITDTGIASDQLVICGDLADHGNLDEYTTLKSLYTSHGLDISTLFPIMGNHDIHTDLAGHSFTGQLAQFESAFGLGNVPYHSAIIDGGSVQVDLIGLSTDVQPADWNDSHYSSAQLAWLTSQLAADQAAGRVSFVFIHEPVHSTVFCSYPPDDWAYDYGLENSDEFKAAVNGYSNVIVFSGHSHCDLKCGGYFFRASADTPFYVHCGGGFYLNDGDESYYAASEGWFVTVYHHRIVLQARDFLNHSWLSYGTTIEY